MKFSTISGAAILAALAVQPAQAKVIDQSELGFTVAHTAQVAATPEDVWKMLKMPQKWWSQEHSWSGDAANFWLDSQAGGCFCEKLPGTGPDKTVGMGSVQHARILFAKPNELLRLSGAFGPLQGEALIGTLTIQIKPTPTGAAIRFDYVLGGYMRFKPAEIAPAVDKVIGEQLIGLAKALGGSLPPTRDEKAAAEAAGESDAKGEAAEAAPPARRESGLDDAMADLLADPPKREEDVPEDEEPERR
ncbi:SRPBCC family protein [Sphingopyxis sp. KK2]|uniref:SRPBCC family protein n=1 Tax=Sphingopyxis sp. KK2 TaxID=1855727 RepID=UPI00097E71C4|nr:SRPBCC family protein [Sphingopyxis sp. KK2]